MSRATNANIAVVGSLNVDLIVNVKRLPQPGETVPAGQLTRRFGGKGANQALAATRQGARVTMIGCVGDDSDGRTYMDELRREKVTVSTMKTARGMTTGTAFIAVDEKGENQIVIYPGANGELTSAAVRNQRARIAVASALLVQLEVPLDAVGAAVEIANECRVPVVLNPSPVNPQFPWGQVKIDVLIANETEAEAVFGKAPDTLESDTAGWSKLLAAKKIASLIVTRGARSTLVIHNGEFFEVPTYKVEPVDTVGAGDTFAGVFTAQRYAGMEFREAVVWANVAGALATLQPGAQQGIPMAGDITRALAAASEA